MAKGFKIADAYVSVIADDEGLRESMTAKIQAAAEGLDANVKIQAVDDGLKADITAKVKEAEAGEQLAIPLVVEDEEAAEKLKAQLEELGHEASVVVNVDTGEAEVKLAELGAEAEVVKEDVKGIGDGSSGDMSALTASIDNLATKLDGLGSSSDDAGNKVADTGQKAANAGNAAGGAGGGFGGLSGMMMAAVGAALTLGPALAALPALLSGLGLGGIAAFGALKDVVGALTAANTSAAATGTTAAQAAQTAYSNAVAIRNAEQSIADAKRASAIAAQNSADSIVAANQQVQQSEQAEAQAATALAQAKIDAANQIADLNNSSADAANSVSDAQLGVQQAQQNLTSVMSNSLSTDLQKKQAQQALVDAEQALTDAKQRAKEATEASTKADQEGVANFPPVVQAQLAYQQAVLATANAQHALQVAQRNASDQQLSSAESVQKAEQSLTDTLKQQQLAAAAAASSGSSGANAYAQAMAKLTPVGQQVVEMLRSMSAGFTAASQNSFLPGVLAFLKDVAPLMPQFIGMVSQAGQVFGGLLAQLGGLFTQKQFASDFFTILQQGVGMMSTIGGGVLQMIHGIVTAAAGAGPIVTAVGQGIADLLAAIGPLLQGLTTNATGAGQTISAVIGFVADLLGPLGTLVGTISGALGPALTLLRPILDQVVNVLMAALVPAIKDLSPILVDVVKIFGDLVRAVAPIIPPIMQVVDVLLNAINQILTPIIPLIAQLASTIGNTLASEIVNLIPLVTTVTNALVQLMPVLVPLIQDWISVANALAPIMPILVKLATTVLDTVIPPLTQLLLWLGKLVDYTSGTATKELVKFITDMVSQISSAATSVESFLGHIQGYWNNFVSFLGGIPGAIGRALSGMWDPIWNGFKAAMNFVIGGWDSLHFTLPSVNLGPLGSFGGETIGVPQIPYLAQGGTSTEGGVAVVGDAGPELMYMPKGATVVPLPTGTPVNTATGTGGDVRIDNLTIKMDAIVDLTNPNAMTAAARAFVTRLRDALKLLDAAYS